MKNETELELALNEAVTAATRAGDLIVEWSRQAKYEVRQKQGSELVTTADLRSDELIRERLGSKFPQHRFLSEEVVVENKFDFSGPVLRGEGFIVATPGIFEQLYKLLISQ